MVVWTVINSETNNVKVMEIFPFNLAVFETRAKARAVARTLRKEGFDVDVVPSYLTRRKNS